MKLYDNRWASPDKVDTGTAKIRNNATWEEDHGKEKNIHT